jgi:L-fuconolactonase
LVGETVDSHVHLWDARHTPQPWMTSEHEAINRPFGPEDIAPLLARNAIDRIIVVQGACLDSDTDYLFEEAARSEWIGAVITWVRLDDPHRAAARLDGLSVRPKFRGVRHLTHNEPAHSILQPLVLESVATLEERDLILELPVVWPRHFDAVVNLSARFPRLRIVIDHLGKLPIGTPEMVRWADALATAADFPNVFAKVSGFNTALDEPNWTISDLRPSVETALACFGPDCLMCGSDWPYSLLNGEFDRVWGLTSQALAEGGPGAADRLLGGNARHVYRFADLPGTS